MPPSEGDDSHAKFPAESLKRTMSKMKLSALVRTACLSSLFSVALVGVNNVTAQEVSDKVAPKEVTVESTEIKTDLLAGQWCGSWVSCKNGHHGKLRATFCRLNDSQVQAVFVGSFAKILPFRYKAVLRVVHEEEGLIKLQGSQKLGPIMGTFCYEATITGDQFQASYRAKRDWGKWTMTRVSCCN